MGAINQRGRILDVARDEFRGVDGKDSTAPDVPTLSPAKREAILDSVIASQALEGIHVSREVAAQLLDEVLREPLLKV